MTTWKMYEYKVEDWEKIKKYIKITSKSFYALYQYEFSVCFYDWRLLDIQSTWIVFLCHIRTSDVFEEVPCVYTDGHNNLDKQIIDLKSE